MPPSDATAPLFVANDLALDFINSAYGPPTAPVDVLVDDAAVVLWLTEAGVVAAGSVRAPKGMLALAIALRDEARGLLAAARAGKPLQADRVNAVLERGRPVLELSSMPSDATPVLVERRRDDSPEALLQPVALALGQLLAGGDLQHVGQCEAHDCSLLFHDTTKSRKRRWCSMALCGNRMKVAAFRSRRQFVPTQG
ncbi:CGNR zinc finger domain-containing protein [Stenotrophomonas sp. CFBP 13718]|uniref:CGNR zinc finger domain-containing protein n=1 Tax=Stenotrophomonas sp. CFBP 13718 TaxID=2775304 RepID=UPI001782308C|nr:CGNR zinc finger domain-containing protein [Stenotrophomonas sp. CFBP 13718]MBD8694620.1 CGNR zinc finger domain-containing protein [Stenotrophomonas sp. CFBP 13718]